MGSLVTDFIINPVLRQARRFSRSSPEEEANNNITTQTNTQNDVHEAAVEDISGRLEGLRGEDRTTNVTTGNISGTVLTSSPIEDDGGLEAELRTLQHGRLPSDPTTYANAAPRRVMSLTSEPTQVDDEMSDNPSFGVPQRFRSASGTSFGYSVQHPSTLSYTNASSRRSTQDQSRSGSGSHQRNSSLPADDGMGYLRKEIRAIQSSDARPAEKARLMHLLLTRGYMQSQQAYLAKQEPKLLNLGGMISQERPTSPGSLTSFLWQMNGIPESAAHDQHTFHLSPRDLQPTYAPLEPPEVDEEGDVEIKDKDVIPQLGCKHYRRNVKLQCSACSRWYTCRLCHDEIEDHVLIRKETKNMLCMICSCAQKAGEFCVGCGERTAWYYCDFCKLWDNDPNKSIYHCHDCGICRKGRGLGKDFFHCKTCGTCMSMAVEQSHKCIERASDCDCPICGEYMFTSPTPVVFMPCGHSIHKACYEEHMKTSYKCPICSKSTVNMESQFRNLDRAIDSQPMPPQFRDTKAMVSCNDCYAKSAVAYHWLGLKCAICDSYNTVQLSLLSDPEVEVPVIDSVEENPTLTPTDQAEDMSGSATLRPSAGPTRVRRHSTHMHLPSTSLGAGRFSPYPVPQRIARSVSPLPGLGFFNEGADGHPESDESVGDDDLDFWGRDEPRSVTSFENVDDNDMEDEESDDDSGLDDCDDDEVDEDDPLELLGHR